MSISRFLTLISAVLALVALAAIPTTAGARSTVRDTASAAVTPAADDDPTDGEDVAGNADDNVSEECDLSLPDTEGVAGDTSDDFGDDTATDDVTDPTASDAGADDQPDFTDENADGIDDSTQDLSGQGDGPPVVCDDLGKGVQASLPGDDTAGDDLDKNQLNVDYHLDQGGTVTTTLESASGARAVIAASRVIARGTKRTKKAGAVRVKVRLTSYGRKVLKRAHKTLRLTLRTRIKLADGSVVRHSKTIKVKPRKAKSKKH